MQIVRICLKNMKAKNLTKLAEHNINVPKFIILNESHKDLTDRLEKFLPNQKVAIRSSHSTEDLKDCSNAGKFLTFLNVENNRIDYVNKVFEYCKTVSNGQTEVIVQEMIDSDYSGVIFTSNPQGLLNEMVVNIGCGLGDKVVDNKIDTTTYYKNKFNNRGYYETKGNSPIIKESIIEKLFELGFKIESIYGNPMDIEFAIKKDTVYCLQARPITTLKTSKTIVLDNSNISENFPGVVCPLTSDFVSTVYSVAFKDAISKICTSKQLKDFEPIVNNMVIENNSRMYYKIDNWYKLLEQLPFSTKLLEIWEEMIGINDMNYVKSKVSLFDKTTLGLKFIKIIFTTQKQMHNLDVYFKKEIENYRKRILDGNLKDTLSLYNDIKDDFGSKWGITLYNDLYAFIFMALSKKFENKIVNGIDDIESAKPIQLLKEISKALKHGDEEKINILKSKFISLYGDRYIEELKLETKTPRVNPSLLDSIITNNINIDSKRTSECKTKESFFEKYAKKGIRGREISRLNRSRLFGVVREIFIHIGKEFVNMKYINAYEDIFYLRYYEIEQAILNGSDNVDFKCLIQERKETLKLHFELPTYDRLLFSVEPFSKYPLNVNDNCFGVVSSNLRGIPVSNGICVGEAIVIDKVNFDMDVTDKILVTKSTDPGWVFLMEKAKGVITERGSLLSHTSIVARELQKPSIVAITNITDIIKTGDVIEIDGTVGTVKILKQREI